jgi:hypothetical protein
MHWRRTLAFIGGIVLATALAGTVAWAAGHAGSRPPSQAPIAKELAREVVGASNSTARYRALLDVMKALQIGVYTSRGRPIVRGAERRITDLYLYDFEVREIAAAFARHQKFGVRDVADLLTRVGIKPSGHPVDPALLGRLLRAAARRAVDAPAEPTSLVPLLIRELGLRARQSNDVAGGAPIDKIRLDPLQNFLLDVSFLGLPVRRHAAGRRALSVSGVCPDIKPEEEPKTQVGDKALAWWAEKALGQASETLERAFQIKDLIENAIDGLHGSVVAYGLKVRRLDNLLETHYGPAGHAPDAGKQLKFRVKVEYLDDLGEGTIDCLSLAGVKLPQRGPLPKVPVLWDPAAGDEDLADHGSVTPELGLLHAAKSVTDSAGVATLTFVPNDESLPGKGFVRIVHGSVRAIALWADAFENKLGKINQYLTPIYDSIPWEVSRHEQYVFEATVDGTQQTSSNGTQHSDGYPPDGACGFDSTAKGTQSLSFRSPERVRLVFYRGKDGRFVMEPSTANIVVTGPITRDASVDILRAAPCNLGAGTGGQPPSPDCGTTSFTSTADLGYDKGAAEFGREFGELRGEFGAADFENPFNFCELLESQYAEGLAPVSVALDPSQITNEKKNRIDVTTSKTIPESANSSEESYTATTIVSFRLTLERVRRR